MHRLNPSARTLLPRRRVSRRRGMALLLVMIGMIVCTILTAGFLASQGTSIGIARNERDASKCRGIAQTGVDMCYWLIRNKSDWRETMNTGTWLNNVAIGEGTVTTSVSDGDGTGSFADDPAQPAIVTSTGVYDNRRFSLTATIRPTGGGTVFANGNFIQGSLQVGNDLFGATIDSYNSGLAPYNSASPGSNASFGSNATGAGALLVYFPSVFRGTYTAAPTALLSNILSLIGLGAAGPTSIVNGTESRNPGTVIFPNTAGLVARGNLNKNSNPACNFGLPGQYDFCTIKGTPVTINTSGIYYITGDLLIQSGSSVLNVADGVSAVVIVTGNANIQKPVGCLGTGRMALYCNGTLTVSSTSMNSGGSTSALTIFGSAACNSISVQGSSTVVGAIYTPQASVTLQNSGKIYGAIVAHDLTLKNTSQLHFDEALRSLYISNITGGSAPPGKADYLITITGGPGVAR